MPTTGNEATSKVALYDSTIKIPKEKQGNDAQVDMLSRQMGGELSGEKGMSVDPCMFELREAGSCRRKDKCKFVHDFSPTLREDEASHGLGLDLGQRPATDHYPKVSYCILYLCDG